MSPHPLRTVRSFVLRQGRMTIKQREALEGFWPAYGLSVDQGPLDFDLAFGRQADTILEIGFGMGSSLLGMALQHPEKNYLGVEVHLPGVGALLAGIEEQALTNVRVYKEDVLPVLKQCIPDGSLQGVQIFFPDPWPKRRHHKRRLIQTDFVELLCKKLQPGGFLHLATDWEDYAESMLAVLGANQSLKNEAGEDAYYAGEPIRLTTKFERRGERLGHPVRDLLFRLVASPSDLEG